MKRSYKRKPSEVLAVYYQDNTIDCYTFVLNEKFNNYGMFTCLATCHDGRRFSMYSSCSYRKEDDNKHLGVLVQWHDLDTTLRKHVLSRLY